MTTFTTNYLLPKPAGTDAPDGPNQIGALADGVDSLLLASFAPLYARKTSDQIVNSSSILVSDTQLTVAVAANAVYRFESHFGFNSNSTADFKWIYSIPAAATYTLGVLGYDVTATLVSNGMFDQTITLTARSASIDRMGSVWGNLITGANSGSFTMTWAQNVANASNTIVRSGSWLHLMRVA